MYDGALKSACDACSRSPNEKTWIIILDVMSSLPIVNLIWNEFLCKLEEVAEIRFIVDIVLTEDWSSILTRNCFRVNSINNNILWLRGGGR